jgi:succinyl-CoA synthetase beta subunit
VVALREVVVRLSEIISRLNDRIETLEINPLIVAPKGHGVWAADALVGLAPKH